MVRLRDSERIAESVFFGSIFCQSVALSIIFHIRVVLPVAGSPPTAIIFFT
jgi:hypothetical protein